MKLYLVTAPFHNMFSLSDRNKIREAKTSEKLLYVVSKKKLQTINLQKLYNLRKLIDRIHDLVTGLDRTDPTRNWQHIYQDKTILRPKETSSIPPLSLTKQEEQIKGNELVMLN